MRREEGSCIPPEHQEVGGEPSEAEEVLSYWFPEDLVSPDLEAPRRHGQRWMHGYSVAPPTPEELDCLRTGTPPHLRQPPPS